MPTTERVVGHVFATVRVPVKGADGKDRIVRRTVQRGQPLPEGTPQSEVDRLERAGAFVAEGDSLEAALARALNPADNHPEHRAAVSAPIPTVSPPPLGAAPEGPLTKGDTGAEDAQPVPGAGEGGEEAGPGFDARGASLDDAQEWLREERPNAGDTVAAANGDPEAAETLLEAERLVRGGDPRATVEEPLQKIIDGPAE
jgi:hypothetical protein